MLFKHVDQVLGQHDHRDAVAPAGSFRIANFLREDGLFGYVLTYKAESVRCRLCVGTTIGLDSWRGMRFVIMSLHAYALRDLSLL